MRSYYLARVLGKLCNIEPLCMVGPLFSWQHGIGWAKCLEHASSTVRDYKKYQTLTLSSYLVIGHHALILLKIPRWDHNLKHFTKSCHEIQRPIPRDWWSWYLAWFCGQNSWGLDLTHLELQGLEPCSSLVSVTSRVKCRKASMKCMTGKEWRRMFSCKRNKWF